MVLRSLRDCRRILANVISGARVAVVGGSFIAMEAAASLFGRGLSVDVISPEEHPLEKVFGRELSDLILELTPARGCAFTSARVARIEDKQVLLQGGERIDADIVVVGPFFWTKHFDLSIRYVGHAEKCDEVRVEGDLARRDGLVRFRRAGTDLAVATVERDKESLRAELRRRVPAVLMNKLGDGCARF
jgi:NADPH-dependent 2,4-dienoyl-CoA reductase/sulfur reductase-like enzyme